MIVTYLVWTIIFRIRGLPGCT